MLERSLRNGVLFVLAWVALVTCLCGWCASVGGMLAWVGCFRMQREWGGWCANVVGVSVVLTWVACYYYCSCYYWNTILKEKMLNVYLWNKNQKMFQIDLNSGLKEEPDLKSRCCFTLFELVMPGYMSYLYIYIHQICLDMCNFVNLHEYAWNIKCLNKPELLRCLNLLA